MNAGAAQGMTTTKFYICVGAMDASNMLKPALARGELHCVGATTLNEYRKYIEKDPALSRRFQPVYVPEPTIVDTIAMLRGLKPKLEAHHGVKITDAAIVAAATMSNRYVTDRFLPDKAIDLVDESASSLRLLQESKPEVLDFIDRSIIIARIELEALKNENDPASMERKAKLEEKVKNEQAESNKLSQQWNLERDELKRVKEVKKKIEDVQLAMDNALRNGDFVTASKIKYDELPKLEREKNPKFEFTMVSSNVSSNDIARVVAKATGM